MGLKITPAADDEFLEIAANTGAVTAGFLNGLIDEIAGHVAGKQYESVKILLIVTAPRADLTLMETYHVWQRAYQKGIGRTQIAYVIDGRPVGQLAKFVEAIARNRHILLQFFEHRDAALQWLTVTTSETGHVI